VSEPTRRQAPLNLAGAIYGQIISTGVVITAAEYDESGTSDILATVVGTMLVFWAAHAYAEVISRHVERAWPLPWREVRDAMAHEWPIAQSALPAAFALGLGAIGVLGYDASVDLAIGFGVVALFGWGLLIGFRQGLGWPATLGVSAVTGGFGLLLVLLEVLVH
jgi:hypothetical protein